MVEEQWFATIAYVQTNAGSQLEDFETGVAVWVNEK